MTDQSEADAHEGSTTRSSLFSFEKKPQLTTALALFTEQNKPELLELMNARRIAEGLGTTSNFPLFNKIRSEEYRKCAEEEMASWVDLAKRINEEALTAWEQPPDEEDLLRYLPITHLTSRVFTIL